ncbi:hypothetical protein [Arthrobacter sp. H5]|uniref:DUF7847 domain-containing protein n=1 Tax=Arthrobacter sp. H5 TaxID=1267973 RepID=UPI001C1E1990|nr:hypothetical protein [Arthrobacter sp. H5]
MVVALVTVLLTFGLTGSLATFDPFTASVEETSGFVASLLSITTVLVLMTAVGLLILQGVLIIPIARAVLNQKTGFSQLWKLAGRRILPLIGLGALLLLIWTVAIVVLVLIFVGLALALEEASIAIIIIGVLGALAAAVWINMKFVLAPAALMLEGAGPINALKRSWTLTTRNWWRTFGILILTSIIVSIITQVVATPISLIVFTSTSFSTSPETASAEILQSLPALLITQAITAVFTAIGYAFQAGVTALLYVDLRIRREGFDVVLLREHESATPGIGNAIPGQSRGPGSQEFGHNPQSPEDPRPGAWN